MNPDRPHMAIINVSFMIYELDATGHPNGLTVGKNAIISTGVKPKTVRVSGETYQDCLEKLKAKLDEFV